MRSGIVPFLGFDKDGEIAVVASGSDACAEHECGSAEMQQLFCSTTGHAVIDGRPRPLGFSVSSQKHFEGYFTGQVQIEFPGLVERKRLSQNLGLVAFDVIDCSVEKERVAFLRGNCSLDEAMCSIDGFRSVFSVGVRSKAMASCLFDSTKRLRVAGAWNESSFCIAVRGNYLVERLGRFHERLLSGQCAFGGSFVEDLCDFRLSGVIVVDLARLSDSQTKGLEQAQRRFVADSLLSMSEASALVTRARLSQSRRESAGRLGYSFFWNVWHPLDHINASGDWVEEFVAARKVPRVACAVNPSRESGLSYYGPYDANDLVAFERGELNSIKTIYDKMIAQKAMA